MNYQFTKDMQGNVSELVIIGITGAGVKMFIPNDARNGDWQAYQEWLAAGNTPAAADSN